MELNQAHHLYQLHIRRFLTVLVISSLIFTAVTPVNAASGFSERLASAKKGPSTAPDQAIPQKRVAAGEQEPQAAPVGINLKCSSISDGLADLGLCEPDIKPFLSNSFNISGNGYNGKVPNQSIKVVCDGWGCTQVPVYFSLSCAVDWRTNFSRHISIHATVKNGTAFYITPAAETLVDCGTGMEGKCFVNLTGYAPGSYISPSPNLDAHLFATMDMVGEVDSTRVYDFSCGWSWSLDPITTLLDRSSLSQNSPKNGAGDPRECAVSACDASASAGDPIDTRTGNFDYSLVDLSLQTIASPLTFQRSYASLATDRGQYPTDLGPGWTHNQDTRLVFETGKVWFKAHTLNQYQFTDNGDQTYTPYAGVLASLDYAAGTSSYTLTAADQSVYTFDATGQLQSWRNELGYGFDYAYAAGKLYRVTEPLSGRYLQFNYQNGRLSSVNDQTSRQVSFGYDSNGDLTSFTDTRGYAWTYTYNAHRLTILKDPNNQVILTNAYNAQGRAYEQFNGLGQRIVKITYNSDGTRTLTDALDRPSVDGYDARGANTFHTDSAGYTVFKEYDANFRLSRILDPEGNAARYTWSPDGASLTATQDMEGYTSSMVCDAENHLTQVTDPRGQVIDYTWVDGLLDHQTRHTLEWGDITTKYSYTTAADAPQPPGLVKTVTDALSHTTTFTYDASGQLVTTPYTLDLAAGLSQVLSDGTHTYLYGLERIAQQSAGGTGYFLPDGLGSVRQVANASGMVGDPWAYDPFGNPLGASGSNASAYGYAGEWTDGSGLQYLRARYYSPEQGRFITQDPFPGYMTQPATLNPYAYVTNDPATLTDPSGENPLAFLGVGLVSGLVSAGIDVGVQLFAMQPSSLSQALRCLNWGQVGISFGVGAIAGLTGFGVFGGMTALLGTGLAANVASGAVAGIFAGQYARLTALTLTGQTDQIRSTLFRPQDLALDAALGAIGSAVSYGIQRGLSGIAKGILQRLTDSANRRLGANPGMAQEFLSQPELLAGQANPSIARLQYGNAIERMVARQIGRNPLLSSIFEHVGGPNNPDFIGKGIFAGLNFDITTNTTRSIASHLSRAYGPGLIITTYSRPIGFGVFP